jgi:hypothetical protein
MRAIIPCLAPWLVVAFFPGGHAAQAETPAPHLVLTYESYASGVPVAAMQADLQLDATAYRLRFSFHTNGLAGWLFNSRSDSFAEGRFTPAIRPARYQSSGTTRGTARQTRIDYPDGHPIVTLLTPADDEPREPIPAAQQAGSLDALSTIAHMLRQVARTGRCDDQRTTFDGRRLLALQSTTAGQETLETTSRSPWSGPALRCDITSQQIAGFLKDADPEGARKIRHATAWLQRVTDGGLMVPVRLDIETAWIAMAHVYLTSAKNSPD